MRNASLTPYQPLPLILVSLSVRPLPPSVSVTLKKVRSTKLPYYLTNQLHLFVNVHPTLTVGSNPVTIGLRQSYYSTVEGQGPVEICISTFSGDFDGNSFTINYSTISGQAEGTYISSHTHTHTHMCPHTHTHTHTTHTHTHTHTHTCIHASTHTQQSL